MKPIYSLIVLIIVFALAYTQLTIFVVQPLGALPEGRTLVMLKMNKTNFIDSADAICEREMGGVNLLCRGFTLSAVLKKGNVLFKLPYSETLYTISTNGKNFSR